ncbi:hypothetical protein [Mangrovibacter phragmitis]|uniref:hypothetical protein n=1 Tax=Mangrovibacter phragmitis TaxID=1691903 RepID=UPI003517D76E
MVKEKLELFRSLMRGSISYDSFIEEYEAKYGFLDICKELGSAKEGKDAKAIDVYLYLGSLIQYEYSCMDILNELLLSDWHNKHEDLVRIIENKKSKSSVDYLYNAIFMKLEYMDYDDDYVFATKCVRALSKIGGDAAMKKLKLLCASGNNIIKDRAMKEIKNNKKE